MIFMCPAHRPSPPSPRSAPRQRAHAGTRDATGQQQRRPGGRRNRAAAARAVLALTRLRDPVCAFDFLAWYVVRPAAWCLIPVCLLASPYRAYGTRRAVRLFSSPMLLMISPSCPFCANRCASRRRLLSPDPRRVLVPLVPSVCCQHTSSPFTHYISSVGNVYMHP